MALTFVLESKRRGTSRSIGKRFSSGSSTSVRPPAIRSRRKSEGGQSLDRASLSLWQLAPARLRDFNQGFDAGQPSLAVLEPGGRFFPGGEPAHLVGRLESERQVERAGGVGGVEDQTIGTL